jgi:hypothetical protein
MKAFAVQNLKHPIVIKTEFHDKVSSSLLLTLHIRSPRPFHHTQLHQVTFFTLHVSYIYAYMSFTV